MVQGSVEGLENWRTEFDGTGMKPGVYNILVEGTDSAGNTAIAGPFNIRIDPETDLPVVSISYPPSGTRIGGRLVMVGTCDEDDAVDRVEWRIDGGEWRLAEGKNFWAVAMDAGILPDGTYRIGVRGVDIHGTAGREVTVPLVFDSSIPSMEVDSRQPGALAAGRVGLDGRVLDGNGIAALEVSVDGRQSYVPVKLSGKKGGDTRFSYTLDSRRLADGPFVIWFRTVDRAGSVGYSPFLLLVDNTPPQLELISPAMGEAVNGSFVAVGAVRDDVGLASLGWILGGASGSIALEAGNPYWVLPLSVPGDKKPSKTRLQLKATDLAGNVTTLNANLSIDPTADLPLVQLVSPKDGAVVEGAFRLTGTVHDDDGAAALWYRMDNAEPVRVPATGAFAASVPASGSGKRNLSVWAEDTSGLMGPPVVLSLLQAGEPVRMDLELVSVPGPDRTMVDQPFIPGMEFAPGSGAVLRGSAVGGSRIVSLSYSWAGSSPLALAVPRAAGAVPFSVPLPKDGPWGSVNLEILAKDEHDRETRFKSLVYLTNFSRTRGDPLVRFDDPQPGPEGLRRISQDRPLIGSFSGAVLARVELEPASKHLSIASDQDRIIVRATGEGPPARHTVVVHTDKGHVFRSEELYLGTDLSAPILTLRPLPAFVGQGVAVAGAATDASGITSVRARLRGQSAWNDFATSGQAERVEFSFELPLEGVAEGPVFVEVEATDSAGQARLGLVATVKDVSPPTFRVITPGPVQPGAYRVAGYLRDAGGIASVEGPDGLIEVAADGFISLLVRPDPGSRPVLKVSDRAGNVAELELPWNDTVLAGSSAAAVQPSGTDPAAPASRTPAKPELVLLWPPAGEILDGDFTAVVQVRSTDPLASLVWSGGGNSGVLDPAENPVHVIRFPATALGARKLSLSVNAKTTAGGATTLSVPLAIDSAKAAPQIKIEVPPSPFRTPVVFLSATAASGVGGFSFVLDGAAPRTIESSGALVLELPALAVGTRMLTVSAQGLAGAGSAGIRHSVLVAGAGPRIRVGALVGKDGRRDFPGAGAMVLPVDANLSGTVEAPNDLASLSISFAGGNPLSLSPRKAAVGSFAFEAALPRNLPPGLLEFVIVAVDKAGIEDRYAGSFYRTLPPPPAGLNDEEGLRFNDSRITEAPGVATTVLLFDDSPLLGRFVGRPLKSVKLDVPNPVISVTFEGSLIRLIPGDEGMTQPVSIVARTVDGDEFTWGPFIAVRDRSVPEFVVRTPQPDAWVQDRMAVQLIASDANGIRRVEVSTDGSSWTAMILETPVTGAPVYRADLDLGPVPEGGIFLTVRAVDGAGRVAQSVVAVSKDVTAPVIRLVAPAAVDSPNGRTTVAAQVSDAGSVALLELALAGEAFQPVPHGSVISAVAELTGNKASPAPIVFRATDRAGNITGFEPPSAVDPVADLPIAVIQAPREGELVRSDFTVSGVVFDDDGAAVTHYRLDGGEWTRVELQGSSFSIPFDLAQVGDNEHLVEVFGEDLYGVTGGIASVRFRISTAEPTGFMTGPSLEDTVRGLVMITGTASDENGIAEVHVSFDNAVSFHRAEGAENWSYPLDTRILSDGTRSIIIRTLDAYGVEGISAGIMTADNVPPTVTMDVPGDGEAIFRTLNISGRVGDTTAIAEVYAELLGTGSGKPLVRLDPGTDSVVQATMDVSGLRGGNYILRLGARDKAANLSFVTRELVIHESRPGLSLDIRVPVAGERVTGKLLVAGRFSGVTHTATVSILANGAEIGSAELDNAGYYSTLIAEDRLPADGLLVLSARAFDPEGIPVGSREVRFEWAKEGPWVTVESLDFGEYIPYRPFLSGRVGWTGELPVDPKEARAVLKSRTPSRVEVSLDDGRSFAVAKGGREWRFRLETQDYPEGGLFPIVRVRYEDGSEAVVRTVFGLDKTAPNLVVLDPVEGALFDNLIPVNGTAGDDRGLAGVLVYLRAGDKAGYELPSFIQGLYLDAHFLGASYWDLGLGLTFFEDAVKLQVQLGSAPPVTEAADSVRFGGTVYGIKLLASLARLPFGFLLGPDWDFLSAEAMVGANFSYFSESASGTGLVIAAVVAQLEFPKLTIRKWSFLRTYSFYTEAQFWSVSSDVQSGVVPRLSFGLRFGLF